MSKLVDTFYNRPDAEPFREPVNWKEIGLTDYPKVIKNPMDLGTVKEKLKKRGYKTLFQVGEDVRLVWTNCMTYNQDGSDFYKLADSLHRKWDDKYTKLLQECTATQPKDGPSGGGATAAASAGGLPEGAKASLKEKRDFARALFSLTKEDLGRVLVEVEAKCPAALKRNSTEDEIELNVDNISGAVLQELTKFVESATKKKKKAAPAAKKAKTG